MEPQACKALSAAPITPIHLISTATGRRRITTRLMESISTRRLNNLISYSPAPEALQEVQVVTANSPVGSGNVNGAGVFSVLKSGTNSFHGSAYGYVQDYQFNANSWQNNNQGIKINPFTQSQFGGTFGGPIKRDKLFFLR